MHPAADDACMDRRDGVDARHAGWPPFAFTAGALHARPLCADDEGLYVSLYTDAAVMRHVGAPLATEAATRAFRAVLRQLARDPPGAWYWALTLPPSPEAIGIMALVPDRGRISAELGLVLRPRMQGRGHASAAIIALQSALVRQSGPDRLWTRHLRGNEAAAGLMRRVRFRPDGARDGFDRWHSPRADWPLEGAVDMP